MHTAIKYLPLVDALRLLPGVKPLTERNRLGEAKYWASRSPKGWVDFNGARLTLADFEQLFIADEQGRPRVSPAGAALLLSLYERGVFASQEGRNSPGNLELLAQYAQGEVGLVERLTRQPAANRTKRAPRRSPRTTVQEVPASPMPTYLPGLTVHRLD